MTLSTLSRNFRLLGSVSLKNSSSSATFPLFTASRFPQSTQIKPLVSSFRSFSEIRFCKSHEYLKLSDGSVGITDFAQSQMGDVVYVDLPEVGDEMEQGEAFGSVESVKAASDVYMPVTGEIIAVNEKVVESPGLVNTSPFEEGWFIKIKVKDEEQLNDLLGEKEYQEHCEAEKAEE